MCQTRKVAKMLELLQMLIKSTVMAYSFVRFMVNSS